MSSLQEEESSRGSNISLSTNRYINSSQNHDRINNEETNIETENNNYYNQINSAQNHDRIQITQRRTKNRRHYTKRPITIRSNINDRFKLGTIIHTKFRQGVFQGEIIQDNNPLYKIRYTDGDMEDLHHHQVQERICNKASRIVNRHRKRDSFFMDQVTLRGVNIDATDGEAFSHFYPKYPGDDCLIITFVNAGQMPKTVFREEGKKARGIAKAFKTSKASIALYVAVDINESKIPFNERFDQRMRRISPGSRSFLTNNTVTSSNSWCNPGGTAITIDGNFWAHMTLDGYGKDLMGLGRWNWIRLRGANGIKTRFILAYRPCESKEGTSTVWTQQVNYFRDSCDIASPNPRQLFDKDLLDLIDKWLELGDVIVLGIDMNEDVCTGDLAYQLKERGLHNAILSRHSEFSPPATFNGNTKRTPVDAIWCTKGIEIERAGYCPFQGTGPSSPTDGHRMLWIEANNFSLLGKNIPHSTAAIETDCIRSYDPKSVKLYNKLLAEEYNRLGITKLMKNIKKDRKKFNKGTMVRHQLADYHVHMAKRTNKFHNLTWKAEERVAVN